MAEETVYDLVTIGAGSGGVRASRFASTLYGAKVAVVELPFGFVSSDTIGGAGGTCVIRGCVPKKLLVYGSSYTDEFTDAAGFGWTVGDTKHDWSSLIQFKTKEIQRLNGVYNNVLKGANVESIEGAGSIVDPQTVSVTLPDGSKRTLKTRNILIATGGKATKIPIEGAEYAITSDEALALESLPEGPVIVLGAGYIATEFAGIFRGVRKETHILFRGDKVLRGFDEECRAQVQENLTQRGVIVHASATPKSIKKLGEDKYQLTYADPDGALHTLEAGLIMMATGRAPRTDGLNLQALGIEFDKAHAIKVDDYSRTNVPGIWAVGDVTNRVNLTPVALMEGMAFAKSAFGGELAKPDYEYIPSAVFCSPPLATVGYSEEAAAEAFTGDIDVYVSRFRPMKFILAGRDEKTLMKLIVHVPTDRVIGIHMVGPDAPEILQGLAVAVKAGATKAIFDATVGIHPTAAEEFVTMRTKTRRITGKGAAKL